jgi:hypothetical protein
MPVPVPSTSGGEEALAPGAGALAARVAAGAGSLEGEEWLADLRRESLLESLMSDGAVAAAASAEHGHKLERALNAEVTALSLACGALFPVLGYDAVLALVFGGIFPDLRRAAAHISTLHMCSGQPLSDASGNRAKS